MIWAKLIGEISYILHPGKGLNMLESFIKIRPYLQTVIDPNNNVNIFKLK
jgi:hypothetical protein